MTDEEFLIAFERCELPEEDWTHLAHVRMAWLRLQGGTWRQVLPVVREGIKRYNATLNKLLAYHETITRGFLILIDHRIDRKNGSKSFEEFCAKNPELLDSQLAALLKHYRRETLFSPAARAEFVEPDLMPLPADAGNSQGLRSA
jgi:hypothetical protein